MAIREKMAQRAQPFLEPGEQVRQIFIGQTGPSPYFALLSYWIVILFGKYRMVRPAKPKGLVKRIPRNTPLGPIHGALWAPVQLEDERIWVHKRFHKDVE